MHGRTFERKMGSRGSTRVVLELDAFTRWAGSEGSLRARNGVVPTLSGCVNKVHSTSAECSSRSSAMLLHLAGLVKATNCRI